MTTAPRSLAIALASAFLFGSLAVRAQMPVAAAVSQPQPAAAPVQPLPYSHKTHLALGLTCRTCHVNPGEGRLMTYPATAICMGCHQTIATDRPAIQKLTAFAAAGGVIPWVRVYKLPEYVFWKHGTHLQAEVTCAECHGPVPERDVITLETNITTMAGCMTCHNKRQVFTDCGDCHAPRQSSGAVLH